VPQVRPGVPGPKMICFKCLRQIARLSLPAQGIVFSARERKSNALNKVNFGMLDSGLTDSSFGQLPYAQSPRILQFSLKVLF
jgi:hypothetical protein